MESCHLERSRAVVALERSSVGALPDGIAWSRSCFARICLARSRYALGGLSGGLRRRGAVNAPDGDHEDHDHRDGRGNDPGLVAAVSDLGIILIWAIGETGIAHAF